MTSITASIPGFACPQCGSHIPTSFDLLLSDQPFYCSSCGLKLQLDREESSAALEALSLLKNGISDAERIKRGGG